MSDFDQLVKDTLDCWWRFSPISATFAGVHDHDLELDDVSREAVERDITEHKSLLRRWEGLNQALLVTDARLDRELMVDALKSSIRGLEEQRHWETNPAGPVQVGLYGVFALVVRDFAPLEQRAEAMLSRLRQVKRVLAQGRVVLRDPPEVFTRVARDVTQGGIAFYEDFLPAIADQVPNLRAELLDACRQAVAASRDYLRFLTDELLPRSRGRFAIGRELFDFFLRHSHGLEYDADDLVDIGSEVLETTEAELARLANEIAPGRAWWDIVTELKRDHPGGPELVAAYRREMERARDFVRAHDLVTIPPGEELELILTPAFERSTIPYAAYMAPAPFETAQKGLFYVTPVDETLPPEKQEEQLRGHYRSKLVVTALHEAYPGHHLQLVHSNRASSPVRKLVGTPVFAEGWALYCEELMYEQGFYRDPRVRLAQLKDQVWRGCRVLIDVGLHTRGMTFDQAVEMLMTRAHVERISAEAEVKRYCSTPTQPMSYVVGKYQILALKKDYQTRMGSRFNLKEFHDRLLSFGTIPVAKVRRAMFGEAG